MLARTRRVAKWIGLAGCTAISIAFVAGGWVTVEATRRNDAGSRSYMLASGRLGLERLTYITADHWPGPPSSTRIETARRPAWDWSYDSVRLPPHTAAMTHGTLVWIPLWPALIPLIAPPLYRLGRALLHREPGKCRHCRYDLAGLSPGARCPECGRSP